MIGSLTDGSTETFWESGDEDKNKTKSITISCVKGINASNVTVHVDNSRDIGVRGSRSIVLVLRHRLDQNGIADNLFVIFTEQSHISDILMWKSSRGSVQNQTGMVLCETTGFSSICKAVCMDRFLSSPNQHHSSARCFYKVLFDLVTLAPDLLPCSRTL